ncbi:MAG: hypothetical protein DI606_07085 [Sphingobium sp.]|uniref:hypothetical protein n=1 Tax=Sphingobium sp. TaxID=1912891 RepID=UPI000DAFBC35|nr:hypothetical protein [Sphingobium sp.]PZU13074.1 MAG: hypothetical protein DI606_07085 [Sphingobium sp.]
MARIVTIVYLIFMLVVGWRLHAVRWPVAGKLTAALALLLPIPLLVLVPALMHPERPLSDMLRMIGLSLLVCGLLCMGGGWSAARLRARRG